MIGSKLVNVLKMSEKAVPMVAEVTLSLVQGYGHTQLFVEMLRLIVTNSFFEQSVAQSVR